MATAGIANLVDIRAAKATKATPPPVGDSRPVVRVEPGERERVATEAEEHLLAKPGNDLYKQGSRIVRIIWDKIKVAGGGDGETLRLSTVGLPTVLERFESSARFEKWSAQADDYITCDCPDKVAEAYMGRDGTWKLPYLLGVVTAPTLRADGSLLDKPGYDSATGLVYDPAGWTFPAAPQAPTLADAKAALAALKEPIALFPFLNDTHRAVALSAIMTAVLRRALPTAPMHAFTAPTAGSGKSLLVDIAAIIATGERAAVTTTGKDKFGDTELEKRLTSSMLASDAVLSIDNMEGPLGGELLCALLTQPRVKLRPLGRSVNIEVPVTTAFFATSNNLIVVGDMTRRVLTCMLDPGVERPELREFPFNAMAMVRARRGELVMAVLTIVRAYLAEAITPGEAPLGSFEEWSKLVRDPLMWLGEPDPTAVLESVRASDPRLARLKEMGAAWEGVFGNDAVTIRVVADACQLQRDGGGFVNRELRDAVTGVTGDRDPQPINPNKLAWWLRKNAGRFIDKKRFTQTTGEDEKYARWALEGAIAAPSAHVNSSGVGSRMPDGRPLDDDIPF